MDDFVLEEHSGEPGEDEHAGNLELDAFQANEIRQVFLTTLPEYLEPVSQMLDQIFAAPDGQDDVRRALHTTLSSISVAAARVGIDDVCNAVDAMRDQLLALDNDATLSRPELEQKLREAFVVLEGLAGGGQHRAGGAPKQTIVAALRGIEDIDKSMLERLTAAGLVTVDQLQIANHGEVVAVTGLDPASVDRLFELLVPGKKRDRRPSRAAAAEASIFDVDVPMPMLEPPSLPTSVGKELRDQVDMESEVDELRAEILATRLRIAASKERIGAAEQRHNRLERELTSVRSRTADSLTRLTAARLEAVKSEREQSERQQSIEQATRRIVGLKREYKTMVLEREELSQAISGLVDRLARVKKVSSGVESDELSDDEGILDQDPTAFLGSSR